MNIEEIEKIVQKECPDMLSDDNFIKSLVDYCYNGTAIDIKSFSAKQYAAWDKIHEILTTATVGQVIKYLKENFKSTDKLCYMDCVEGCKNDCTYVTKDQLGERFFYYVKDLKERFCKFYKDADKETADSQYPYVNDNDVVVC